MVTKNSSERASRSRKRPASSKRLTDLKKRAEREYARVLAQGGEREAAIWKFVTDQLFDADNPAPFEAILRFERTPVTIDEFVASEEFLGGRIEIWPALMDDLRAMNPDVFVGEAPVHEALLGGATATGKTTLAMVPGRLS